MKLTKHCVENHFLKTLEVISKIKSRHSKKPKEDIMGTIECPACGNEIEYSVSSINGHTQGICKTDKCIAWIE